MTPLAAALLAGVTAWCLVCSRRQLEGRDEPSQVSSGLVWASGGVVVAVVTSPWLGPWAWCGPVLAGTLMWLVKTRLSERRATKARERVSTACRDLAGDLSLGRIPATALESVDASSPLASAAALLRVGGDVVALWREEAQRPGEEAKLLLARAWEVSVRSGSPMSELLAIVSVQAEKDAELARQIDAELAGPTMTAAILAALPLVGIGLGYAIGGDPWQFLHGSLAGNICLVAAVALTCAGLIWNEQMVRAVRRTT